MKWWEGGKKLHSEQFHNLLSSPSTIRMIKSKRMRWTWHVARMGLRGMLTGFLVGKPEEKRPIGRPRHRWLIILKWILKWI
jgi:hypothetical protein